MSLLVTFTWRQNKWTLKEVILSNIFRILNETKSCAWRNFLAAGTGYYYYYYFPVETQPQEKKRLKKLDLRQGIKDAQGSSSVTHFYTLHHLPGKEESFSFLLMLSWFKGSKWMTDHTSFFPLPSSSSSSLGLRRWRWEEKSDHRYRDIISSSLLYTCLGNIFGLMTKRIRSYRHWDDGRECHSSRKIEEGRWSRSEDQLHQKHQKSTG